MAQIEYTDAYLSRLISDEIEARARAEVALLDPDSTFSESWSDTLARLKAYVIVCIENQAAPDDLFTAKLKSYRAEFDAALARAQLDAEVIDGPLLFTLPIERA